MEDSALSWHWGMAISIKKDGPMRLWTDAAVFINENDIEVLLNQGAHPTKVHFRKPSLGKGAITGNQC